MPATRPRSNAAIPVPSSPTRTTAQASSGGTTVQVEETIIADTSNNADVALGQGSETFLGPSEDDSEMPNLGSLNDLERVLSRSRSGEPPEYRAGGERAEWNTSV